MYTYYTQTIYVLYTYYTHTIQCIHTIYVLYTKYTYSTHYTHYVFTNRSPPPQSIGTTGNKAKVILAPTLAACGIKCPILSARGVVIFGGVLGKLATIPGFTGTRSFKEIRLLLNTIGWVTLTTSSGIEGTGHLVSSYSVPSHFVLIHSVPSHFLPIKTQIIHISISQLDIFLVTK